MKTITAREDYNTVKPDAVANSAAVHLVSTFVMIGCFIQRQSAESVCGLAFESV